MESSDFPTPIDRLIFFTALNGLENGVVASGKMTMKLPAQHGVKRPGQTGDKLKSVWAGYCLTVPAER